jgi:hypothetical protein
LEPKANINAFNPFGNQTSTHSTHSTKYSNEIPQKPNNNKNKKLKHDKKTKIPLAHLVPQPKTRTKYPKNLPSSERH